MSIKEIIQTLINEKDIRKKKIYEVLDISAQAYNKKEKLGTYSLKDLEKIANLLDVPINTFIEDKEKNLNIGDNNNLAIGKNANITLDTCKAEIEYLKKELQLKDKIIQLLENK